MINHNRSGYEIKGDLMQTSIAAIFSSTMNALLSVQRKTGMLFIKEKPATSWMQHHNIKEITVCVLKIKAERP